MKKYIKKLMEKKDLNFDETTQAMTMMLNNQATPVQMASYITALAMKGATVDEVCASAMCLREHTEILDHDIDAIEIAGTGSDNSRGFNVSTVSAFVAAAGGCKVAKHGNRSNRGESGSADMLDALGVNINLSAEECLKLLEEKGFCYIYVPKYHSSMKYLTPILKEIGVRTIFDTLGTVVNPAPTKRLVVGVHREELLEPMAKVLMSMGVEKGMCVYGLDGLDEISTCAPTKIYEFGGGEIKNYTVQPEDFGYRSSDTNEIVSRTPEGNAAIARAIYAGEERDSKRDLVCLNAGAVLYVDGKAPDLKSGVKLAEETIDSGKVRILLDEIIEAGNIDYKVCDE